MYNPRSLKCPIHPTMVHPCQICAQPVLRPTASAADVAALEGTNWETEGQVTYNTNQPRDKQPFNESERIIKQVGDDAVTEPEPPATQFPSSL